MGNKRLFIRKVSSDQTMPKRTLKQHKTKGRLCISFAAALLILLVVFQTNVFAAGGNLEYTSEDTGFRAVLEDDADLLSDAEESLLLERMKKILPYGNVAFVSTEESNYDAHEYARSWYLSNLGEVSGTMLLIDMYNRRIEIFSGQQMYQTLSTVRANEITDNIYTYASAGNYYRCADAAFEQMATILEGGAILTPMKYATSAAFAVGIALLINFLIIYVQRKKSKNVLALRSAVEPVKPKNNGVVKNVRAVMTSQTKHRHVESSGGGGGGGFSGGGGGGGFSGGGGGGFSGGGGGHSF